MSPRADTLDRLLAACGARLVVEDRPGSGVDRSTIRELLRLTPDERLELAAREANALEVIR